MNPTEDEIRDLVQAVRYNINDLEMSDYMFSYETIVHHLKASKFSINMTTYKLCLIMSDSTASMKLGPIEMGGNLAYWRDMASLYLGLYKEEQAELAGVSTRGGYKTMKRVDEP